MLFKPIRSIVQTIVKLEPFCIPKCSSPLWLSSLSGPLLNFQGRNGRGSIFVFAAGNGGLIVKDSCEFNGYVNSIHTIAITGINSDGSIPIYGENCAGIMAVTYSRDLFGDESPVVRQIGLFQ